MGDLIRKSHNVSLLMYHIVCIAKYRRLVITEEVDSVLKSVCIEISKCYEIRFLEIALKLIMSIFCAICSNLYSQSSIK
jgi:putative transposase